MAMTMLPVVKSTLLTHVADFFRRHALAGSSGVVGLSGGPDSVCLAKILHDLYVSGNIAKLVLAHLNHQLRGSESAADEAFVLALAQAWRLPCHTSRLDVALEAKQSGANLEEAARRYRYDWLTRIALQEGAVWVAAGHTADDQAETVLFRLLRGSGLQGLGGMRERRPLAPGLELIRPLLNVRRQAIIAFLEEHGQSYRQDSSNRDVRFTRNQLRHELLPLLAQRYNPAVADILCRLAEQAREAHEEVVLRADDLLARAELPRAGEIIVLAVEELARASRPVQRELFRRVWLREGWPMGRMTFDAWQSVAQLVEGNATTLDLPEGITARRVGRVVQLMHAV
jgi:tRNA(Ile)-lysidine synthase